VKKTINTILIFMLTLLAFTSCDNSPIFNEISQKAPSDNRNLEIIGQKGNLIYFKSKNGIESYDHATKSYTTLTSNPDAASSAVFFFDTTGSNIIIYNERDPKNIKFYILNFTNNELIDDVTPTGLPDNATLRSGGSYALVLSKNKSEIQAYTATCTGTEINFTKQATAITLLETGTKVVSFINNAIIVGNEDDLHSEIFLVSNDGTLKIEQSIKFETKENGTKTLKELGEDVSIVTPDNKFIVLDNGEIYYRAENTENFIYQADAADSVGRVPAFSGDIGGKPTLVFTYGSTTYVYKYDTTSETNKVETMSSGVRNPSEICGYFDIGATSTILIATKNNGFYELEL